MPSRREFMGALAGASVAGLIAACTPTGLQMAGYVPWQYLSQHPYVQYQSDLPDYARISFDVEQKLVNVGILDPTLQYYSKTQYSSQGIQAQQTFSDAINEIILGHRPLTDYDGLVQQWRTSAGAQIRKEYLDAIAAAAQERGGKRVELPESATGRAPSQSALEVRPITRFSAQVAVGRTSSAA